MENGIEDPFTDSRLVFSVQPSEHLYEHLYNHTVSYGNYNGATLPANNQVFFDTNQSSTSIIQNSNYLNYVPIYKSDTVIIPNNNQISHDENYNSGATEMFPYCNQPNVGATYDIATMVLQNNILPNIGSNYDGTLLQNTHQNYIGAAYNNTAMVYPKIQTNGEMLQAYRGAQYWWGNF